MTVFGDLESLSSIQHGRGGGKEDLVSLVENALLAVEREEEREHANAKLRNGERRRWKRGLKKGIGCLVPAQGPKEDRRRGESRGSREEEEVKGVWSRSAATTS